MRQVKFVLGYLALAAIAWVPLSSFAMSKAMKMEWGAQWWLEAVALPYLWWNYAANANVAYWLPICALGAAALVLFPLVLVLSDGSKRRLRPARPGEKPPAPQRAFSNLHGNADWMSERDMRRQAGRSHPEHGGVVFGAACRLDLHPGQDGGSAPLLRDPCTEDATHGQVYYASGGGKTTAITGPNLHPDEGWRGNVLVNDPSSQAGAMFAGWRRDLDQRVVFLGPPRAPADADQAPRVGIDVFEGIHPSSPSFEQDVTTAVESLGREFDPNAMSGENSMFKLQGRALQCCLLADMLADPATPAGERTPLGLLDRAMMDDFDLRGKLETIAVESRSSLARRIAKNLKKAHPKTFGSFMTEASADLKWLLVERHGEIVSGTAPGSIKPSDFVHGNLCIFLQLGLETMQRTPQVGRAILNALLGAIYRTDHLLDRRTLLLLDERVLFGKLEALSIVGSQGRKYGVTCVNMWHSPAQMEGLLGKEEARTWRTNSAWEAYSAPDHDTAKVLSERLGKYTGLVPSEGQSRSSSGGQGGRSTGANYGLTLQPCLLMTPDQIEFGMDKREQIVFRRGVKGPMRCAKAYYFLRPEMADTAGRDAYRDAAE